MEFSQTLKKNFEFRRLYSRGLSFATPLLVIYCKKNNSSENRYGITVGKKVGCAVCRNKARRRIKEIYRLNEKSLNRGYDIVLVARVRIGHATYASIEKDFLYLIKKAGLLRNVDD